VQEIAEDCNILIGSCHDILKTKLEIHRAVSKFVPWLLTRDQRDGCVAVMLARIKTFWKKIITSNETWVYG
jgi:hypothetical protein